jgi:type IV pilus assembly protein PilW
MTRPPLLHRRRARRQQGVTLIELLIGLALSLMIVLALVTLMINVNRNNAELSRTNSVIENGRFAQQLIEADLVHAGFWGGYVPTFDDLSLSGAAGNANSATAVSFPTQVPDPCATYPGDWSTDYKARLIGIPVQVYPIGAGGVSPVCTGVITNAQPNSDVLLVRHAAPCPAVAGASEPDCQNVANNVFFQTSRCGSDAASWVLSANAADLTLHTAKKDAGGACTTTAAKYRFMSTLYWVRNYFTTAGDGIPTLVRTRFQLVGGTVAHQNTETLVDGVQMLRIQLGVDNLAKPTVAGGTGATLTTAKFQSDVGWNSTATYYTPLNRGDGNADTYVSCTDAGSPCSDAFNLANTVAVRIHLLARAATTTPGYVDNKSYTVGGVTVAGGSDRYKRHVYSQTVRLNNISMRREVPPP